MTLIRPDTDYSCSYNCYYCNDEYDEYGNYWYCFRFDKKLESQDGDSGLNWRCTECLENNIKNNT